MLLVEKVLEISISLKHLMEIKVRSQYEAPPMNFWYVVGFRELVLFTFLSFAKIVVYQLPRVLFFWVYDTLLDSVLL